MSRRIGQTAPVTAGATAETTTARWVVLFGAVVCGTTGTAVQWLVPDAAPLSAGAMRLAVGALTLVVTAGIAGQRWLHFRGHRRWLLAGGVAVAAYQGCFFTGTTRAGVALGTVVALGSAPMFSGLIDAVLFRRVPSRRWMAGTLLAVVGVALIAGNRPSGAVDAVGVLAALGAGLGWATYAKIGQQRMGLGLHSTASMAGMFVVGAVLSLPLLAAVDSGWVLTRAGAALSLYLGVITIGVVYTSFGWGLRKLSAPSVVTLTLAEPMTAAVLSVVVLHQPMPLIGWVGVVTVLLALMLSAG